MPASEAISGRLTAFKRGDGASSEAFTSLGENTNFTLNPGTREFIDVTHAESPSSYREFITGLRDGGVVSITGNFVYTDFNTLKTDFDSDDSVNYQIVLNDSGNTTFQFTGFVTDLPIVAPFDGKVELTVTIKVTGPMTIIP